MVYCILVLFCYYDEELRQVNVIQEKVYIVHNHTDWHGPDLSSGEDLSQ